MTGDEIGGVVPQAARKNAEQTARAANAPTMVALLPLNRLIGFVVSEFPANGQSGEGFCGTGKGQRNKWWQSNSAFSQTSPNELFFKEKSAASENGTTARDDFSSRFFCAERQNKVRFFSCEAGSRFLI